MATSSVQLRYCILIKVLIRVRSRKNHFFPYSSESEVSFESVINIEYIVHQTYRHVQCIILFRLLLNARDVTHFLGDSYSHNLAK